MALNCCVSVSICPCDFGRTLWLWSKLVPLMAHSLEVVTLLPLTRSIATMPYLGLGADLIVRCVKHGCRAPRLMRDRRCLRQGRLLFLSMAGHSPALRFGVGRRSAAILTPPLPDMVEILRHAVSVCAGPSRENAVAR